ncbi:MAG: M15 family metallopeptidase [Ruminococcus sp.]|nr:M15 family metallopeptidase [Ruminococcus sp.]MDY4908851.1 M15 family metallopeptidase [Candidatus Fimenecus sp.]
MENNNKKGISKRTLCTKIILLVILAVIMVPLIILYKSVGDTTPKIKLYDRNQTENSSENQEAQTTEPQTEPQTEPVSEEPQAVPETKTAEKKPATIIPITDAEKWNLAIINTKYPLPDSYAPTLSNAINGSNIQLDSRVSEGYAEMYAAAKLSGCVLTPYSGYHSYALQETNYNRKVNFYVNQGISAEEANQKASAQVLPAGCSEHNAGLAMDIVSASSDFINTKEYKWLCENAHNYGFILRYPEDKTAITGMNFEPWHWRYVGTQAAKEMKEKNQCLEEYLGLA